MQERPPRQLTQRQQNEKKHYDSLYGMCAKDSGGRFIFPPAEQVFDCVSGKRRPYNQDWAFLREISELNLEGKTVLEIGCGDGAYSIIYAHLGAKVYALDLSESAIEVATQLAHFYGLEDRITFACTTVEDANYLPEMFDAVVGAYILHHIEIEQSSRRIRHVLKPGGTSLFLEWVTWWPFDKVRSHPTVHRLFPPGDGDATEDEHKVDDHDLAILRRHFSSVTLRRFYNLARICYFFPRLLAFSTKLDYYLQEFIPFMRNMGGRRNHQDDQVRLEGEQQGEWSGPLCSRPGGERYSIARAYSTWPADDFLHRSLNSKRHAYAPATS